MTEGVRLIVPGERSEGSATPGMVREEAVSTNGMWAGLVRTAAGTVSGWHHHGACESMIFVVSGALRMEFGPDGRDVLEAEAGDFLYIAPGAVHREGNPGASESQIVVARAGSGEPVFNVDGPGNG